VHGAALTVHEESVGLLDDEAGDTVTELGIWAAKPTMQSWRRRVGTTLIPRGATMSVTHGVAKSISAALAAELGEQRRHLAPPRCGAHDGRAWWWESSGLGGSADARTRGPPRRTTACGNEPSTRTGNRHLVIVHSGGEGSSVRGGGGLVCTRWREGRATSPFTSSSARRGPSSSPQMVAQGRTTQWPLQEPD
jgi:hypothetical protein